MSLKQIVATRSGDLTRTDRRLLEVLLGRPAEAAFWRAQDLTRPLGLHEAAATRLAQHLGFSGYPPLRDALRQDYLDNDGPSKRVRDLLDRSGSAELLTSFVADEMATLADLPRHVTQAELDTAAERIMLSRQVYLFGQGNATVLVDQLARRLQRFGVATTILVGADRDIAERLLTLGDQDLVIAFAFRRTPKPLMPLLTAAERAGAASLLITDTLLSVLPTPSILLSAPRGRSSEFHSLLVPMSISNALVLTIARRAPESALRSLDRLGTLLEHFDV